MNQKYRKNKKNKNPKLGWFTLFLHKVLLHTKLCKRTSNIAKLKEARSPIREIYDKTSDQSAN